MCLAHNVKAVAMTQVHVCGYLRCCYRGAIVSHMTGQPVEHVVSAAMHHITKQPTTLQWGRAQYVLHSRIRFSL